MAMFWIVFDMFSLFSFSSRPQAVAKMVLINAQGFIDGAPKVGPLGPLGIKVLGSWPLRWMANQMAYFDKAGHRQM